MPDDDLRYCPAWWLPSAHLQTLWGPLMRTRSAVVTTVERLAMADGDTVAIERLSAPAEAPYVQGLLAGARQHGWGADVIVFRGCGGEPNIARRFYHSGETTDLDAVIGRIASEHPRSALLFAGFSLGGNVLLKWLGELGVRVPAQVVAAAAVSVPFDLERGARHIHRGFARVYEQNFLASLRRKALAKRARYPDLPDDKAIRGARSIYDFDDIVTAPVHGFRDASDYYSRSSARVWLAGVRRPVLLLSARDDPFLPADVLDDVAVIARDNPWIAMQIESRGGHCGFVQGTAPWRARYYAERRVVHYLAAALAAFRAQRSADTFSRPLTGGEPECVVQSI
jgi:predicted alpha/beta-fold hydrolase